MRSPRGGWGNSGSWQLLQIAEGGDAGQEEVAAAPCPHELWQVAVAAADRAGRRGEGCPAAVAASDERVRGVVQAVERRVVQPAVLHELELPGQVGGQADEVDTGRAVRPASRAGAVAAPAADQPVQ